MEGKSAEFILFLGGSSLNFLAWATGPSALVLSVGLVAVGLTGIGVGIFSWNKVSGFARLTTQASSELVSLACGSFHPQASENKMQKRQSSESSKSSETFGYLGHNIHPWVVMSGIVIFLLIFFYCFTSFLTYGENSMKLRLGNGSPAAA